MSLGFFQLHGSLLHALPELRMYVKERLIQDPFNATKRLESELLILHLQCKRLGVAYVFPPSKDKAQASEKE